MPETKEVKETQRMEELKTTTGYSKEHSLFLIKIILIKIIFNISWGTLGPLVW